MKRESRSERALWTAFILGSNAPKHAKYKNEKIDGFDSKRERKRYGELQLLQQIGEIKDLRRQVRYELIPKQNGHRATYWIADFVYTDVSTGEEIQEDCKGVRTAVYQIKKKLFFQRYGKQIRET